MKKLLNRAMALLARRDHSEYELRRKLAAQPVFRSPAYSTPKKPQNKSSNANLLASPNTLSQEQLNQHIESVIQYCYKYHWLDDEKFAKSFIHSRSAKGYGPQRIQSELQQKGVNKEIIYSVLADSNIVWLELANELVMKHFTKQATLDWKSKAKVYNYLVYRGFYLEDINEAIKANQC